MPLSQRTHISHFLTSLNLDNSSPQPTIHSTFASLKNTSAPQIVAIALCCSPFLLLAPLPTGKYYIIHGTTVNAITSRGKQRKRQDKEGGDIEQLGDISLSASVLLHITRLPVQMTGLWQSHKSCYLQKADLISLSSQCSFPTFSLFTPNGVRVAGAPSGSVPPQMHCGH